MSFSAMGNSACRRALRHGPAASLVRETSLDAAIWCSLFARPAAKSAGRASMPGFSIVADEIGAKRKRRANGRSSRAVVWFLKQG